jgi:dCTP deaminase
MDDFAPGILPDHALRRLVAGGTVVSSAGEIAPASIQPASLDLTLGPKAYRLRCSFLPGRDSVSAKLEDYLMGELDLRDGAVLERERPYLIPLNESLRLPARLQAKTNPKSSTGRLDIFTRVIRDNGPQFDQVRPGYEGPLYLEVVSRTFTVNVRAGLSLNQLRVFAGSPRVSDSDLQALHRETPLLYAGKTPVGPDALETAEGVFLSVDLSRRDRIAGYRAKKNSTLLDLSRGMYYDPDDFWEEVHPEHKGRLVLEPEEFYLLLSWERVRIPPGYAAEMVAYDPTSGELRTHYAGFFDPGFGFGAGGELTGTPAVLEVRAHDVPFMIESGQQVCKLVYERMSSEPESVYGAEIGSSYHEQGLNLSKHFRERSRTQGELPGL